MGAMKQPVHNHYDFRTNMPDGGAAQEARTYSAEQIHRLMHANTAHQSLSGFLQACLRRSSVVNNACGQYLPKHARGCCRNGVEHRHTQQDEAAFLDRASVGVQHVARRRCEPQEFNAVTQTPLQPVPLFGRVTLVAEVGYAVQPCLREHDVGEICAQQRSCAWKIHSTRGVANTGRTILVQVSAIRQAQVSQFFTCQPRHQHIQHAFKAWVGLAQRIALENVKL